MEAVFFSKTRSHSAVPLCLYSQNLVTIAQMTETMVSINLACCYLGTKKCINRSASSLSLSLSLTVVICLCIRELNDMFIEL